MTREQKLQMIKKLKEYCDYYEKTYINTKDLIDMVAVVVLKKHAYIFSKTGAILEFVLTQDEATQCESDIKCMVNKGALEKAKYSFKVTNKILNYKSGTCLR